MTSYQYHVLLIRTCSQEMVHSRVGNNIAMALDASTELSPYVDADDRISSPSRDAIATVTQQQQQHGCNSLMIDDLCVCICIHLPARPAFVDEATPLPLSRPFIFAHPPMTIIVVCFML